ncbi:MAG: aminopeptidase [Elusimicrobia bacterium]|nr:aminopeptidase [Elusimicrobiota bacterium]
MPSRAAVLALAVALSGCSPVYVFKAWRGHARLLSSRRPIERVLADPATPEPLREKLRVVLDARRFAFETVGIPPTDNYTEYAAVKGPAVTWVVSASRRTRFEAKRWWFPFVGRVPYKGHFERSDAEAERAALERDDWDAACGGVSAYSTLRWLRDPVLSTMLESGPGETAELLLHELSHAAVFFKGQVDFNEAFATYVGETAGAEFLASRFGTESAELAEYRRALGERAAKAKTVDALYDELAALYGGPGSDAEKLEARKKVFERYREPLGLATLNNAVVLAHRRYRYDLSDFATARRRTGGDWRKWLAEMKSLDPKDPRADLKRRLATPG